VSRGRWLACALVFAAACGDGRTPLVLYSPHGRDLLQLLETEYERQHPDVDVRWLDMGSQEVYDRIRSEAANPQADVWFGGPDTIFVRGVEDGLLAPYRPTWADGVPAASRDADDLYFGLYRAVPLLIYNSDAVAEEDAPRDWDDLLDPRWKGKIIIRDPLASGTMRTAFGKVLADSVHATGDEAAGFDWLRRLDGQTKEYAANPALLFQKIVRQEGLVSIWELTDMLFQRQRGAPFGYHFPTSGSPVIDDSIGLVAGAPHADAARSFIDWVGSEDALLLAAREAFRLPARADLPRERLPQWAREALDEIVTAEVDWQLIADRGREWMARWDREVRGQG
jgi:iron(III) transport system substrate-binding protein